jgi:hypothetical protein
MFLPLRTFPAFAGAALLLLAVPACSLNPQPLPPGDQPDSGAAEIAADASVASDGSLFGGGADGGTTPAGDGSTPGTPGVDGGAGADSGSTTGDGGLVATDAETEAAVDASADGSTEE